MNASLFGKLFHDEHGHFHDDWAGGFPQRIIKMPDGERGKYIDFHIEKNIREYWKTPGYAEMYLRELNKTTLGNSYTKPSYPEAFYIETVKLMINDGG